MSAQILISIASQPSTANNKKENVFLYCVQAAFLIPISVCVYTTTGGLKATFLSSYIHTVIIYVALCIFAFTVYATGSDLGSPSKVSLSCFAVP